MRVVFITGMARSGTSWFGKILASNPEVLYHFEPFDHKPERIGIPRELKFYGLIEKVEAVKDERPEIAQNMLSFALHRFWEHRGHLLDRAPLLKQPQKPRMMIIKSPKLMPVIETCAHFGQVVYIVRDPRAMVHSLWQTGFGKTYPAKGTAKRWVQWGEKFISLERSNPALFRVVKFEDLVKRPTLTAIETARAIDLPWEAGMDRFIKWSHSRHRNHVYALQKDPVKVLTAWKEGISESANQIIMDTVRESDPWIRWYQ